MDKNKKLNKLIKKVNKQIIPKLEEYYLIKNNRKILVYERNKIKFHDKDGFDKNEKDQQALKSKQDKLWNEIKSIIQNELIPAYDFLCNNNIKFSNKLISDENLRALLFIIFTMNNQCKVLFNVKSSNAVDDIFDRKTTLAILQKLNQVAEKMPNSYKNSSDIDMMVIARL